MIAEAENEYNGAPTPLAEECLKEVRDRAGISDLTGQITSGEDFLTIIRMSVQWSFVLNISVVST